MTMAYCVVSVAVLTRWPWQGSIYLLYWWSAKPETGLWLPFEQHFSPFWPFWLFVPFFLLPQLTVLLCWNVLASLRAIVGNWQLSIDNSFRTHLMAVQLVMRFTQQLRSFPVAFLSFCSTNVSYWNWWKLTRNCRVCQPPDLTIELVNHRWTRHWTRLISLFL